MAKWPRSWRQSTIYKQSVHEYDLERNFQAVRYGKPTFLWPWLVPCSESSSGGSAERFEMPLYAPKYDEAQS